MNMNPKSAAIAMILAVVAVLAIGAAAHDSDADAMEVKVSYVDDGGYFMDVTIGIEGIGTGLEKLVYSVNGVQDTKVTGLDEYEDRPGVYYTEVSSIPDFDKDRIVLEFTFNANAPASIRGSTHTYVSEPTTEPAVKHKVTVSEDIVNGKVSVDKAEAAEGEKVTLTVTPDAGYRVVSVNAGEIPVIAAEGIYSFDMPAGDVVVTATFAEEAAEPVQYTVTFGADIESVKTDGKDLASGDKVPAGTVVTVAAVQKDGQTATVSPALNDGRYAVAADVEFTVAYAPIEYKVTVAQSQNGAVRASPETAVQGARVVLTITPAQGYELDAVRVVGAFGATVAVTDGSFRMPASDVTVSATFKRTAEQPTGGFLVTFGSDVAVQGISSGDRVAAGTVLVVKAVAKAGQTGAVTASVGAIADDGSYTVVSDVSFSASYTEREYEEAMFSGSIDTQTVFKENQQVSVPADSTLQRGARIVIEGKLVVPAGVTVVVSAGAEFIIEGIADIRGDLVVRGADDDASVSAGRFEVSGEAEVSGRLSISGFIGTIGTGKIAIASGSSAEIGSEGTIYGTFEVEEDASLTIAGAITGSTSFDVAGLLTISSDVPTRGFSVDLYRNGSVAIESVVLGVRSAGVGSAAGTITIRDSGLVYYDRTGNNPVSATLARNTVVIDGSITVERGENVVTYDTTFDYGAALSGITVTAASSDNIVGESDADKDRAGQHRHSTVASVSGDMTVGDHIVYGGEMNTPVAKTIGASVVITGADAPGTYARVGGPFSIGSGIDAVMTDVSIEASVSVGKSLTATDVTVKGSVTVAAGAVLTNNGKLDVQEPIDASAQGALAVSPAKVVNAGTVTVTKNGSVAVAREKLANDVTTVDAAYYMAGTSSVVHYYVTIDAGIAALNAGITRSIDLLGKQTLVASATVPANTFISMKTDSMLDIGSRTSTDVVLTIATSPSTSLRNSGSKGIEVYGTLYAERMSNVDSALRSDKIFSDVFSCTLKTNGTPDTRAAARWTNIYTALDQAVAGETVQIQRDIPALRSVAVRDGITLDAEGWTITVDRRATLSVAGTLDLTDPGSRVVLTTESRNSAGRVTATAGALSVTGYVKYPAGDIPVAMSDGSAAVLPGAYYTTSDRGVSTGWYTTYVKGAADAVRAVDRTVTFRPDADGAIVLGDLSVAGEEKGSVTIIAYGDVNARSVTLSHARFMVGNDYKVEAMFVSGLDLVSIKALVGSMDISDNASKVGLVVSSETLSGVTALTIAADLEDYTGKNAAGDTSPVDTIVSVSGSVYAVSDLTVGTDSFVVAGNLIVYGSRNGNVPMEASVENMTVSGTLEIRNGSSLAAVRTLTVDGAATVLEGSLSAGTATVKGSIDATAVDRDGNPVALFTVGIMYVGIDARDYVATTGADASVRGNVTLTNYVLASPSATLPASITGASSPYGATRFVVEDRDYLLSYGVDGNSLRIRSITATVLDAEFQGWYSVEKRTVAVNETVGTDGWEVVTAKLNRAIYTIVVNTDGGINYITAGGKLLSIGENANQFRISGLVAGTYKLEISPRAGYDVSKVKIYNADNVEITMDVQVGGATKPTEYLYSMIGSTTAKAEDNTKGIIDAINKNTEAVKEKDVSVNVREKDNSLTNALLVILVILIVIMGVLVAKRMFRS